MVWYGVDTDNLASCLHETQQLLGSFRVQALHINKHQSVVFALVETEVVFFYVRLVDDIFAHIVHASTAFVDGFPNQGLVGRTSGVGEGLVLHPDGAPHVVFGIKDGDIGVICAMLKGV